MPSLEEFDIRVVALHSSTFTTERSAQYLGSDSHKIENFRKSGFKVTSATQEISGRAKAKLRALSQTLWKQMCLNTSCLNRLSTEDYKNLFCQYKFGADKQILEYLACLLLQKRSGSRSLMSKILQSKVVKALCHKIDFENENLINFLHLRSNDDQVRVSLMKNDKLLKESGITYVNGLLVLF